MPEMLKRGRAGATGVTPSSWSWMGLLSEWFEVSARWRFAKTSQAFEYTTYITQKKNIFQTCG